MKITIYDWCARASGQMLPYKHNQVIEVPDEELLDKAFEIIRNLHGKGLTVMLKQIDEGFVIGVDTKSFYKGGFDS